MSRQVVWTYDELLSSVAFNFNLRRYNEGLMALFFFHVGLEIKREIVFGSLSSIKAGRCGLIR